MYIAFFIQYVHAYYILYFIHLSMYPKHVSCYNIILIKIFITTSQCSDKYIVPDDEYVINFIHIDQQLSEHCTNLHKYHHIVQECLFHYFFLMLICFWMVCSISQVSLSIPMSAPQFKQQSCSVRFDLGQANVPEDSSFFTSSLKSVLGFPP